MREAGVSLEGVVSVADERSAWEWRLRRMCWGWPHVVHRIGEGDGRHFATVVFVVTVVVIVQVVVHAGGVAGTAATRCGSVLPEASGASGTPSTPSVLGDGWIYWARALAVRETVWESRRSLLPSIAISFPIVRDLKGSERRFPPSPFN